MHGLPHPSVAKDFQLVYLCGNPMAPQVHCPKKEGKLSATLNTEPRSWTESCSASNPAGTSEQADSHWCVYFWARDAASNSATCVTHKSTHLFSFVSINNLTWATQINFFQAKQQCFFFFHWHKNNSMSLESPSCWARLIRPGSWEGSGNLQLTRPWQHERLLTLQLSPTMASLRVCADVTRHALLVRRLTTSCRTLALNPQLQNEQTRLALEDFL